MSYDLQPSPVPAFVPAAVNPFLALDPKYVAHLVEARSLCPERRDPFTVGAQS